MSSLDPCVFSFAFSAFDAAELDVDIHLEDGSTVTGKAYKSGECSFSVQLPGEICVASIDVKDTEGGVIGSLTSAVFVEVQPKKQCGDCCGVTLDKIGDLDRDNPLVVKAFRILCDSQCCCESTKVILVGELELTHCADPKAVTFVIPLDGNGEFSLKSLRPEVRYCGSIDLTYTDELGGDPQQFTNPVSFYLTE